MTKWTGATMPGDTGRCRQAGERCRTASGGWQTWQSGKVDWGNCARRRWTLPGSRRRLPANLAKWQSGLGGLCQETLDAVEKPAEAGKLTKARLASLPTLPGDPGRCREAGRGRQTSQAIVRQLATSGCKETAAEKPPEAGKLRKPQFVSLPLGVGG